MKAKDQIKPIELDSVDLLRNFRGEVTIELKDVKTGKVERVEDHNLVTKALEYFMKQGGITNPTAFNASVVRTDFITYMLGGMMCLDTAITDAGGHPEEIVRVPAGVMMTANGARDVANNSNPTEMGTYNDIESGWQQDGSLKMVWDWTTSQGNGTIACVGLSSAYGGMLGIGNKLSKTKRSNSFNPSVYNSVVGASGYTGTPVGIKDNVLYCVQSFYGVSEWTVKKYAFPYTQTDVRDGISLRLLDSITVAIPNEIKNITNSSGGSGMAESYFFKDNVAVIYIGKKDSRGSYPTTEFSNDNPAYVIKYNIATGTVTAQVLNTTNTGISYPAVNQYSFYYGASDKWAVIGNNIVDLSNLANVRTIENLPSTQRVGESSFYGLEVLTSDTFLSSQGNFYIEADTPSGYPTNEYSRLGLFGSMPDNPLMMFGMNALYRDPRYLATIFNLESPVTKTADKTMKVTYILRFN